MADYFFFLKPINKIVFGAFWWVLLMLIILIIPFLRVWWWVLFPLILSYELNKLYLWWIQWDYAYADKKWVVLEVVPPKEILVPLKAMEDIYTIMWAVNYAPPSWREKWCEGDLDDCGSWTSWEIASIEGKLHFYIRVLADGRGALETALYSHYPELEIAEVPDYTKNVPQNLPNKEWNIYGEDFVLSRKPDVYPIRTYEKFFEPQGEKISAEEKRIDPLSSLLELMSKLGPGEQFWMQMTAITVDKNDEAGFYSAAKKEIEKLTKRPVKRSRTFGDTLLEMVSYLVLGPTKEGSGEKASYKWTTATKTEEGSDKELLLSPGEREVLTEVENKIKRPVFRTNLRGLYLAKRENFNPAHKFLTRAYFAHFNTPNLNSIKPAGETKPKTQFFFRKTIPLMRNRKQFRNYVLRFPPLFPNRRGALSILNTEELATLYHFPLKITGLVAPTMTRVESKKGGPPPNLPTE
jgi:hypothetical protein